MDRSLQELVEHLARALVDDAAAVSVRDVGADNTTVLELRVAPGDLGKVIGRKGNTARAVRTVLAAAAAKQHRRAVLNIVEE